VASLQFRRCKPTNKPKKPVPANILTIQHSVSVSDHRPGDWATINANSDQLLQKLANREVIRYLVQRGHGQHHARPPPRGRRRDSPTRPARANDAKLGVSIVFVGLAGHSPATRQQTDPGCGPPSSRSSARSSRSSEYSLLQAYAARTIPAAEAKATNIISDARNVAVSKVTLAEGESARFTNQMAAFQRLRRFTPAGPISKRSPVPSDRPASMSSWQRTLRTC